MESVKEIEAKTIKLEVLEAIMHSGLALHKQRHGENGSDGEDPKQFHALGHLRTTIGRAEKIAPVFDLSKERVALIKMGLAWHDSTITYDKPTDRDNLLTMIIRHRGAREGDGKWGANGNEAVSAKSVEDKMRAAKIFSKAEIDIIRWGIDATYPDVRMGENFKGIEFKKYAYYEVATSQNKGLKEVISKLEEEGITKGFLFSQPHLEKALEDGKSVPPEVIITGLVDLEGVGYAESEEFSKEGDAEMRELYYNIRQQGVMENLAKNDSEKDVENRRKVSEAFLKWQDGQPCFGVWQAIRFEKIIYLLKKSNQIDLKKETELRKFFSHYLENIEQALKRAKNSRTTYEKKSREKNEKEAFISLARSVGYKI